MKKFIIHRIKKLKSSGIAGALAHNLRTRIPDYVDKTRIDDNIVLDGVSFGRAGYSAATEKINVMLENHRQVAGRGARSDAVVMIESFYSISPEYIKNMDRNDIMNYFRDCTDFAVRHYGAGDSNNLISAVVHLDEQTPHLHVLTAPVVDGIFNAKKLVGGSRGVLRKKQTAIHAEVGVKYDLDRGVYRELTGSKHVKNSSIQDLRRQVKLIPTPDDVEIADTSRVHYPDDPTKIDFFTGRAPGILSQQRQIFDSVFRELEGANEIITELDSEREKLIRLVNKQAEQLAVPTEFIRRQLQEENQQVLADERQRQRSRRREAVRRWEKKIRGAQARAEQAQAVAEQARMEAQKKQIHLNNELRRVPALVQQATEAEREKLQQERERIRVDRRRVDRELELARQALKRLEEERREATRERQRYAQLSENVNAQIEDRLAERSAELDASLAKAEITERNLRAQRAALDAAEDAFNTKWEAFQDEREEHGQQMEDWRSQYEAKLIDIRTREKIERVPRDAWIDDLPTAPVVERQPSPLPPTRRSGGGARGPSPFTVRKPRPR